MNLAKTLEGHFTEIVERCKSYILILHILDGNELPIASYKSYNWLSVKISPSTLDRLKNFTQCLVWDRNCTCRKYLSKCEI